MSGLRWASHLAGIARSDRPPIDLFWVRIGGRPGFVVQPLSRSIRSIRLGSCRAPRGALSTASTSGRVNS